METNYPTDSISGHQSDEVVPIAPRLDAAGLERQITSYWSEVLDIDIVDAHDDFFKLGGNSVQAMQIISRLRRRLGIDIPVRLMFDVSTPAGIARAVMERSAA